MAIKILVVDDEPDVAVIFRQKFRKRVAADEFSFCFAENGRSALELLQADPEISLIFTDIRMPSMDGLTFLKEIKALDRQVLLAVVVSAYDDMPNIREAMRQGAWDFVTKPIDLDDLERVLNQAIAEIQQKLEAIALAQRLALAEEDRRLVQRSKELQREFFEDMTHEFRTPLTLLLAPLESALGLSSEKQVVDYLNLAKKGGVQLQDLVNQLLDFSKIDTQKLKPNLQPTDLNQLFLALHEAFEPLAAQRQIRLQIYLEGEIVGVTDRSMLWRIMLNLLSNAIKYSPEHHEVVCKVYPRDSSIEIRIDNTSVEGVSLTETDTLFSRFQPIASVHGKVYGGSGLGLSICKSLVDALGGRISAANGHAAKTCFEITLPIEFVSEKPTELSETNTYNLVSMQLTTFDVDAEQENDDAEKPLLLLAEDHPDMRNYLRQILQTEFNVVALADGRLALDQARLLIPDLVLTDWMMPEMDGLELLKNLRLDRDTAHIPVVMLTARAALEDKLLGIASGSEAFLPKPFQPQELLAVLHGLLSHRERLRERYRKEMLHPEKAPGRSMEDIFIGDIKRVMEQHLMDEQFGVESMADALAMSRRTLMRKLTAVTGQAPVKFIRTYRLERALQMLQDHTAPVWEIAVKTGFGSASYFTKCFKDHFGKSPKEAIHQN